ncbi:MAG: RNA methyltransferase [Erysipelotrichaceae bacterium]|nr:RNA methyltransferase [Erysipelotrichaceae bacterium]
MIIEGAIAVKAAIKGRKRTVEKVYIDRGKKTKDFNYIRKITKEAGIELIELEREQLGEHLTGKSHGGIGAEVSSRKNDELTYGDIFYLEGIEDPFNLGYSMRTLYAFGVKNVLLSPRDYTTMENQLLKSSAGAYDMLNVQITEDAVKQISGYKQQGYSLYALYRGEESTDIFDAKFSDKALFMLGGEKRGISSALLDMADRKFFISYGSDFRNSLNACAALDVVATLLYSQRRK